MEDQIIVGAIQTEILEVPIQIDLQNGYVLQVMGLVNTGSTVSFLVQNLYWSVRPTASRPAKAPE